MTPITFRPFGASLILHVTGESAADVAVTVNNLYNYNIVASVPDTYKEGEHTSVILQSGKKSVVLAKLESMIHAQIDASPELRKLRKDAYGGNPDGYRDSLAIEAERYFDTHFVREVKTEKDEDDNNNHVPMIGFDDDGLSRAQLKEKWAKFAREFRAVNHDSATGTAKTSAE